eukprot:UN03422
MLGMSTFQKISYSRIVFDANIHSQFGLYKIKAGVEFSEENVGDYSCAQIYNVHCTDDWLQCTDLTLLKILIFSVVICLAISLLLTICQKPLTGLCILLLTLILIP